MLGFFPEKKSYSGKWEEQFFKNYEICVNKFETKKLEREKIQWKHYKDEWEWKILFLILWETKNIEERGG